MDMISNECPPIVCLARHIEALECFVEGLDKWPISLHKVLTHSCSYITDLFTLLQVHVLVQCLSGWIKATMRGLLSDVL